MRSPFGRVFPEASQAMLGLERAVRKSSLEPALLELVKLRASQLNGCGYCIDMHTKDALARGSRERVLRGCPEVGLLHHSDHPPRRGPTRAAP
jgi:AhpD family alkylhydroperoxidase